MQYNIIKKTAWLFLFFSLTACNGFFEKDNLPSPKPLASFRPTAMPALLWSTGVGNGVRSNDYLKLGPSVDETAVYAAGTNGTVNAVNKRNGRIIWQTNVQFPITTSPGIGSGVVVVAGRKGEIAALNQATGKLCWRKTVIGEILAKPAVAHDIVVIKTTDGTLFGFSASTGAEIWLFQHQEPNLILRGSSNPVIYNDNVLAGFADGSLGKFNLQTGRLDWLETISVPEGAFAIQRMVDIDAEPIVYDHRIYAATYQGKIASLTWSSGHPIWFRTISSYTGMVADNDTVFISDAKSRVLAFNANSGSLIWEQDRLEARNVTAPAAMGPYIVLGDGYGYLHWINKCDGRLAARTNAGYAMNAAPVVDNNVLYVETNNGTLIAYKLR